MKNIRIILICFLLSGLTACSSSADRNLFSYERTLVRADSLVKSGAVDSAGATRLVADLHRQYNQAKELSGGSRVRIVPVNKHKQLFWEVLVGLMVGLNVWLSIRDIKFTTDRKHRRYLLHLSENEQRLLNNEREREELEECLKEMSLTDEEREEVRQSLVNLMEHDRLLHGENEKLTVRLKEYEKRPIPCEVEKLKEQDKRVRMLDEQVQNLTATLIEQDEMVSHLRCQPKFLTDGQWEHLHQLVDKVYEGFTRSLTENFPQLTSADLQLCQLIRLRFSNAQIATLIAVSPTSVSQQKFRLKKRLLQVDETLFKEGETVDLFIWNY